MARRRLVGRGGFRATWAAGCLRAFFLKNRTRWLAAVFKGTSRPPSTTRFVGVGPCGNDVLERLPRCGVCGLHVSTHLAPSLSTVCIQEFFTLLGGGENLLPLRWSCSVDAIKQCFTLRVASSSAADQLLVVGGTPLGTAFAVALTMLRDRNFAC